MTRVIELADQHNEFIYLEDGFLYYYPSINGGAISAHELREIADELDKRNKEWNDKLYQYFENENNV